MCYRSAGDARRPPGKERALGRWRGELEILLIKNILGVEGQLLLVGTLNCQKFAMIRALSPLLSYKFHEAVDNFQFVSHYTPSMEHDAWTW